MGRLREWIDALDDQGIERARDVEARWPMLIPLAGASVIVAIFSMGARAGHPHGVPFPQSLVIGALFFVVAYAEVRFRTDESSWYGKRVRALAAWRDHSSRRQRLVVFVLIVLAGGLMTVLLVLSESG